MMKLSLVQWELVGRTTGEVVAGVEKTTGAVEAGGVVTGEDSTTGTVAAVTSPA